MVAENYDIIVIGGGPGGYVCAIRAAQLGLKVACIEARGTLGGTCLNVGCIPSKALLESSHHYSHMQHEAKDHGIEVSGLSLNLETMMKRKSVVVLTMTKGIEGLFKKNKVDYFIGKGSFQDAGTVRVTDAKGGTQDLKTKHVVIATGSAPIELPSAKFDEERIVSSTGALAFKKVPESLVVIGGGVIGLELGSVWQRLGSKVTIVEGAPRLLATMDGEIAKEAARIFKKQGMEIHADTKLERVESGKSGLKVVCSTKKGELVLEAEKVLVCVGRKPYVAGLDLEKAGLALDERGRIPTDDHLRTKVATIYAIGDVIHGPMLAHKAEEEGVAVAETISGKSGHVNYRAIPGVIYTFPEIASVGVSEEEAASQGLEVRIGRFPFAANGRAKASGVREGFVKIIADARTDRLLGVHIIGPNASELIGEAVVAFEFDASAEDLARSMHAHPTLTEAIKEAALDVEKRAIHF